MGKKLSLNECNKGTTVVLNTIEEINGSKDYAQFDAQISIKGLTSVNIQNETIEVLLTSGLPINAKIDILWEDAGYQNYQTLGLYGRTITDYQKVVKTGNRTITLYNDNYEAEIRY